MTTHNCDFLDTPTGWKGQRRFHINDGTPCYSPKGMIVQIIPAPVGMMTAYKDDDAPGGEYLTPVTCLALVEDCAGNRTVEAIDIDDGVTNFCADAKNFIEHRFQQGAR